MDGRDISVGQRRIELERPQLTPAGPFTTVWAVDVVLVAGDVQARGMARAFSQQQADLVEAAARTLCADPRVAAAIAAEVTGDARLDAWAEVWDGLAADAGPGPGAAITALAGLDDAVWDLARRELDPTRARPSAARALVYWSGLWLHSSLDELVAETQWAFAQGFDAVKLRVDGGDVDATLARARAVTAVSPAPRSLALEFAGSATPASVEAIVAGLPADRLLWVEDPLPATAEAAVRELGARLTVPIATGEDCWGLPALRDRVERTNTAIPVVDLGMVGGPTAMARFLAEGACQRDEIGVHIDALSAAAVVARAAGTPTVWLEVFDWWGAPSVAAVRERAARWPGGPCD